MKERGYRTEQSNYAYRVQETTDAMGITYFAVIIPSPRDKIRRSCGKWANNKLCNEVIEDFGLNEERREYRNDGKVVIYGE